MSILHAFFGGAGGLSGLQAPEMAGNLNFGQRLMSGSPLNSLMNGPFPNAPQGQQGGILGGLSQMGAFSQPQAQPMQFQPMQNAAANTPDLASFLQSYMASQRFGG